MIADLSYHLPPTTIAGRLTIAKEAAHDPSILDLRLVLKPLNASATPLALPVVVVNVNVKSPRFSARLKRVGHVAST